MLTIVEKPYRICFSRNPIRFSIVTDSLLSTPGLSIEVQVWFRPYWVMNDQLRPFGVVLEMPFTPDINGKISFDFSRVLDSLVNYSLPNFMIGVQDAFSQLGEFFIKYRQTTTANPSPGWVSDEANIKTVTKGGLPYERWAGPNFFLNFDFPGKTWVTWQPSGRYVAAWETIWLTYFHLQPTIVSNAVTVRYKVVYTDKSFNDSVSVSFIHPELKEYSLYRIPAGIEQMNLHTLSTKMIWYYEVRVYENGNPISSSYILYIDHNTDYSRQQFNYFNSLGGLDDVRLLGETETMLDHEIEMAENNPDSSYYSEANLVPQSFRQQVIEQLSYKGNIGWMENEQQQDLLRDFLISKGIFTPKYSRWWPVNVTNKSTSLGNTKNSLREMPIDWSYGFVNENYAPEWMPIGGIAACPVTGVPQIIRNLDNTFNVSWNSSDLHISYIILVQTNGIFDEQTYYTSQNLIILPAVLQGGTLQVRANCGNTLSPFSNPATLQ